MMSQIIDKSRIKQHSLVLRLLEPENAFGEAHHNLIKSFLSYHYVPEIIKSLVSSLYINFFKTSIITDKFVIPAFPVKCGVLKGACLSPLLFNMCFCTFIQYIKATNSNNLVSLPIANQTACSPQNTGFSLQTILQSLRAGRKKTSYSYCFTRWCQWFNMSIRVDKCTSFGVKKFSTRSIQIQPKLFINNEMVPPVITEESFKYLGRH